MDNYQEFSPKQPEKKKIPFDQEPIFRGTRNVGQPATNTAKTSKIVSLLVVLLCVVTCIYGILFGVLFNRKTSDGRYLNLNVATNNGVPQIVDSGSYTDTAVGSAIRSSVIVEAYSDSTLKSYNAGAGVIIDDARGTDGLSKGLVTIVTNYHVCYLASTSRISNHIYVYLCDYVNPNNYSDIKTNRRIECKFVGGSYENDLAILQFNTNSDGVTEPNKVSEITKAQTLMNNSHASKAVFGDSSAISFKDKVFAIGNPGALGTSVTEGSISRPFTLITVDVRSTGRSSEYQVLNCMQIDAAINSGNSGGGLFDQNGYLIGIVNAKQEKLEATAYAIPGNLVQGVALNILSHIDQSTGVGHLTAVTPKALGLEVQYESYTETDDNNSFMKYKFRVFVKSSSNQVFLRANDVILGIQLGDGPMVDIDTPHEFEEQLLFVMQTGVKVTIKYSRGGVVDQKTFTTTSNHFQTIN